MNTLFSNLIYRICINFRVIFLLLHTTRWVSLSKNGKFKHYFPSPHHCPLCFFFLFFFPSTLISSRVKSYTSLLNSIENFDTWNLSLRRKYINFEVYNWGKFCISSVLIFFFHKGVSVGCWLWVWTYDWCLLLRFL